MCIRDSPNGSLSSTITANPIASATETTTYSVAVSGACSDDVVVLQILVTVNELPEANAGEDRVVLADRDFLLEATGGISYIWDNTDFIVDGENTAIPTINILDESIFTVTVTDNNGCINTDEIIVGINEDAKSVVRTINMFTPNGDGTNDVLEFEGLEAFDRINLTVFSRWGNVVYEKRGYQVDNERWDGTRNGSPLPADTYYYILRFDGFEIKSSLTLIRD